MAFETFRKGLADLLLGRRSVDRQAGYYANGFSYSASTRSGVSVDPETAMDNQAVMSAVNLIADGIAQLPLNIYRPNGDSVELVDNTPIANKLRRPNYFSTPYEWKKNLVISILTYGNAYILKDTKAPGSTESQMILLDPTNMKVSANNAGFPVYEDEKRAVSYTYDQIIHIKDIPGFGTTGASSVERAAELIGNFIAAERFISARFAKGLNTSAVVEAEGNLDPDAMEILKASFAPMARNNTDAGSLLGSPRRYEV